VSATADFEVPAAELLAEDERYRREHLGLPTRTVHSEVWGSHTTRCWNAGMAAAVADLEDEPVFGSPTAFVCTCGQAVNPLTMLLIATGGEA
jgi:hypothetical protein